MAIEKKNDKNAHKNVICCNFDVISFKKSNKIIFLNLRSTEKNVLKWRVYSVFHFYLFCGKVVIVHILKISKSN